MQTPTVLAASLVLALGASFAVVRLVRPAPVEAHTEPEVATLAARLDALDERIDALRSELAAKADPVDRRPVDPVDPAAIEAAVAKYLAAHPAAAAGAPADEGGAKADLKPVFQSLLADIDQHATWEKLRESGQVADVVKMFADHAAANPTDADAQTLHGVAICFQLEGMPPSQETGILANKADRLFDRALELDEDHWDARFVKAQALSFWPAMFGKQPEAMRHLEVLRTKQEARATQERKFAQTYLLLGNLYAQQGKSDKAREVWQAGGRLFPEDRELRKKLEQ